MTRAADQPDARIARLRTLLRTHGAADRDERDAVQRALRALDGLARPFDESSARTHITASAIVTDGHDHLVLLLHKRLGLWLQPGGHVEDGEDPADAATRETHEETGLRVAHPPSGPELLHVDVHRGAHEHTHLDLRFLVSASRSAPLVPRQGESPFVAWFSLREARTFVDSSLLSALQKLS